MSRHPASCVCTRCCDQDVMRDNPIHDMEREERRAAQEFAQPGDCYRHDWRRDGYGGGVCIECGETVSQGEL